MSEIAENKMDEAQVLADVKTIHDNYKAMVQQMRHVIVGMDEVIEQLFIALVCRGHCILEGVPGLAKTLLISQLASMLKVSFRRIQFTPDLMPADILGSEILEENRAEGKRFFKFIEGQLFANLILADEINRTPPKTQSALLEAMQERQVTVAGQTYKLAEPFFVLATQNPIEQEGTYPLPEAQLDRFMMKIRVGYPSEAQEIEIAKRVTTDYQFATSQVFTTESIARMQAIVRKVPLADHVYSFAIRLARLTRPGQDHQSTFVNEMVEWGAGPRGSICLLLAAKARAVLHGRFHATTEDIAAMAPPILRHRVVPTFKAEAAGITTDEIIRRLLNPQAAAPVKSRVESKAVKGAQALASHFLQSRR